MRYRDFPGLLGSSGSLVIELDMRDDISAPPRACPLRGSDAAAFARSSAVLLGAPGSGRKPEERERRARALARPARAIRSRSRQRRGGDRGIDAHDTSWGEQLLLGIGGDGRAGGDEQQKTAGKITSLDLNLLPPRGGGASASWKQAGDAPSTSNGRAVPLADPSTAVEPRS